MVEWMQGLAVEYLLYFLLAVTVIWTLSALAKAAERRGQHAQYSRAQALILTHARELTIRRKQYTVLQNYGLEDDSRWLKEMVYFISNVVEPNVGKLDPTKENFRLVYECILTVTSNFRSSKGEYFSEMDSVAYEQLVADTLHQLGWDTRLTKGSGDQGIDVIAEMRGKKVVLQCKHYTSPVGNSAVQEAIAGKAFENADFAAVVSNATFTPHAKQLASSTGAYLLHHDSLATLEEQIFGTTPTTRAEVTGKTPAGDDLPSPSNAGLSEKSVWKISVATFAALAVAIYISKQNSTESDNAASNSDAVVSNQAQPMKPATSTPTVKFTKTRSISADRADSAPPSPSTAAYSAASPPTAVAAPSAEGGATTSLPSPSDDLTPVRSVDANAADHIASYCASATAHAVNHLSEILATCRRNEVNAWHRLVQESEFPAMTTEITQKCTEAPFPDSYVAKEACAKYELHK
jgi:restriction system protein